MGDLVLVEGVDQTSIDEGDGDPQSHHNDVLGHGFEEGVPLRRHQRDVGKGDIHPYNRHHQYKQIYLYTITKTPSLWSTHPYQKPLFQNNIAFTISHVNHGTY